MKQTRRALALTHSGAGNDIPCVRIDMSEREDELHEDERVARVSPGFAKFAIGPTPLAPRASPHSSLTKADKHDKPTKYSKYKT
jgi:hypothetical protein